MKKSIIGVVHSCSIFAKVSGFLVVFFIPVFSETGSNLTFFFVHFTKCLEA